MKSVTFTLLFSGLLLLPSCDKRTKTHSGIPNPEYKTTPDSRLYFKNVRSLFYEKKKHPDSKMDLYTFKSSSTTNPIFRFFIADNWMYEEAYLMLEHDSTIQDFTTCKISYTDTSTQEYTLLLLSAFNKPTFWTLAENLDKAIAANSTIFLHNNGVDSTEIYLDELHRESLRITLIDFKKLTNKL